MRYSQSTELAIDSLFFMAAHPEVSDFSVEQVATAQNVSVSYLAKIFQQLVKAGLLRSHRGSKGGYALARAPQQITLRDVAVVFEGSSPLYECNASAKFCHLGPRCLILATFSEAERKMQEVLSGVTLQDIVAHSAREAAWITPGHNGQGHNGTGAASAKPVQTSPDSVPQAAAYGVLENKE